MKLSSVVTNDSESSSVCSASNASVVIISTSTAVAVPNEFVVKVLGSADGAVDAILFGAIDSVVDCCVVILTGFVGTDDDNDDNSDDNDDEGIDDGFVIGLRVGNRVVGSAICNKIKQKIESNHLRPRRNEQ